MSKLETKHLALKVRTLADADGLVKIFSSHSPPLERDAIVKSVFLSDAHWRKNGFGYWSVFLKDQLIGSIGLQRHPDKSVTLDLEIEKSHRRKGYGKEAIRAVLDFGFRLYKLAEISVKTLDGDSATFLKKLGFTETAPGSYVFKNPAGN